MKNRIAFSVSPVLVLCGLFFSGCPQTPNDTTASLEYTVMYLAASGGRTLIEERYVFRDLVTVADKPPDLEDKQNYIFSGWENSRGDYFEAGETFSIEETRVILFPRWEPGTKYTITYDGSEARGRFEDKRRYDFDEVAQVLPPEFEREGYVFAGWTTGPNGTGEFKQPGTPHEIHGDITFHALWGEPASKDGFQYAKIQGEFTGERLVAIITGYEGRADNVTISGSIGGSPVWSIGYNAFFYDIRKAREDPKYKQPRLTGKLTLPDGIDSIGGGAFEGNQLSSVTIPNNLRYIGDRAFMSNLLESINILPEVTYIGNYAFYHNKVKELAFDHSGLADMIIGNFAFCGNELTAPIEIPARVTAIGASAFAADESFVGHPTGNFLTRVTFSSGSRLESIGSRAFYGNELESAAIPVGVTSIGGEAFASNRLASVTLPDSLLTIGNMAFYDNVLASITLPASLSSIGTFAFSENRLEEIEWTLGMALSKIKDGVFALNLLGSVTIPSSVKTIGSFAFARNNITEVTIGDGVTVNTQALGHNDKKNSSSSTFVEAYAAKRAGTYTYTDNEWKRMNP